MSVEKQLLRKWIYFLGLTYTNLNAFGWSFPVGFTSCHYGGSTRSPKGRSNPRFQQQLAVQSAESQGSCFPSNATGVGSLLWKLLSPPEKCDVNRLSATDLAYIGDVVFELHTRIGTVWPPKRTAALQEEVVSKVRGEVLYYMRL